MSVCVNRTDSPGFFTSCALACGGACRCGVEVKAELVKALAAEPVDEEQVHAQGETPPMPFPDVILRHLSSTPRETA